METTAQIYEQFATNVYRYALFKLNNREAAEDVTSETFLRYLKRDQAVPLTNPKCWLIGVAKHIIFDRFASSAKENVSSLEEELETEPMDKEIEPETEAITAELLEEIKQSLDKLDEPTREVIILKVWEELTFEEIAELLSEKESTIKLRYYRGIEKIKLLLSKKKDKKLAVLALPTIVAALAQMRNDNQYMLASNQVQALISRTDNLFINNSKVNIIKSLRHTPVTTKLLLIFSVGVCSVALVAIGTLLLINSNENKQGGVPTGNSSTASTELTSSSTASAVATVSSTASTEPTVSTSSAASTQPVESTSSVAPALLTFQSNHFALKFQYSAALGSAQYRDDSIAEWPYYNGCRYHEVVTFSGSSLFKFIAGGDTAQCSGIDGVIPYAPSESYTLTTKDGKAVTVAVYDDNGTYNFMANYSYATGVDGGTRYARFSNIWNNHSLSAQELSDVKSQLQVIVSNMEIDLSQAH